MSMTVVVTRNVSDRIRGFLASSMLELAPGVYTAPRINPAVRKRIWKVLQDWFQVEIEASIIMLWSDPQMPGGQSVNVLGLPPIELVALDGLVVSRRDSMPSENAKAL
ncbi:MAG: type I-E CRISPR-associated endoribonuclease Cas2e [Gammaproteobacteria bacterium]